MSDTQEPDSREFGAEEYFASQVFRAGVFHAGAQLHIIYPLARVHVISERGFLAIGSAGADGIEFGYRSGLPGIWAYYPAEVRFKSVAASLGELVRGFSGGTITV